MGLDDFPAMNKEWEAWQDVVNEFHKLGVDVNDRENDALMKAIAYWGEELANLRRGQDPRTVEQAHSEKRGQYGDARRKSRGEST